MLTVGKIREAIKDLADEAPLVLVWAEDPSEDDPSVQVHRFYPSDDRSQLKLSVSVSTLNEEEEEEEDIIDLDDDDEENDWDDDDDDDWDDEEDDDYEEDDEEYEDDLDDDDL